MRAVRISQWGGPEVLELVEDAPVPGCGPEQALVRVTLAGINFADTHAREDAYVARYALPMVPGAEVAGVLDEDGSRVVALTGGTGGYAEWAAVPRDLVVPIPDGVTDGQALAAIIQGLTAWHLLRTVARVAPGETVVVGGAAGGVGSLLVQLARAFGAGRVIGLAGSEDKRALVMELGADEALDQGREDLTEALGPVDVVIESAGGRVFDACFDALAPMGRIVINGIASREQNQVRTGKLLKTSRSVMGFWLFHIIDRPEMVGPPLADLFSRIASGDLRVVEGETYPMSEVRRAHEDLAARRTTGKLLLDPSR
jgi:NADPH2:quinone reductase